MSSDSEHQSINLDDSSTESDTQSIDENVSGEESNDNSMNKIQANDAEDKDFEKSEDSSDDSDDVDDEENNSKTSAPKTVEVQIRNKIINRIKSHIGKQLYVRFNARLPEDEAEFQTKAKALSPLITKATKPRQKHARFCLVDFKTQKDRDDAFVKIRAAINKKVPAFKGVVVSVPRTEAEDFVESLIQKKIKARESKIAKARLKRSINQTKKQKCKRFTSTILVRNLPSNVSKAEIRSLFPNAVNMELKTLKTSKSSIATITLPTSKDAREAVKQNFCMGGARLKITFHGNKTKKISRKEPNNAKKDDQNEAETNTRKVLCA